MESAARQFEWRVISMPKRGHTEEEYEDAYAVADPGTWPFRAAVADGATETAFSGLWAELLVGSFVDGGRPAEDLEGCQEVWAEVVEQRDEEMPWYTSQKAEEGAFATFLGVEWQEDGRWVAKAVGDCCLIRIDEQGVLRSWPVASADGFGNRPALLPSRPHASAPVLQQTSGVVGAEDTFLLATDAVAQWLLSGGWDQLDSAPTGEWEEHVQAAQEEGAMRNDDCTLVAISVQ